MPPKTSSPEIPEAETGHEKRELSPHGKNVFRDASPEQIDHLEAVGGRSTTLSMLQTELLDRLPSISDVREKFNVRKQLASIARERNRITQFDILRNPRFNKDETKRKLADELIAKYRSVENIPAKDLVQLEKDFR